MNIYRIMIANASVLIGLGIFGFMTSGSPTALIAPGIGVILIILSISVKKGNKTMTHIAVALTFVAFMMFLVTGIMRSNTLVIIMAVFTFFAFIMYIMDFMRRKKERESIENKQ
ncbi:MAG TPA: TMEM14 family protein [Ignavibacteria bacterium]|nr:TMEM14 family protein [Ignavibacteria bacterium]HQY52100.1 TMEM14 family protein [Ignavibacteria bacterium]HRB00014.1 TMEM14 family protein [Ignavibacteria bacterium]